MYKYQGRESLKFLFSAAIVQAVESRYDAIVVIPSTSKAMRNRGYSHMHHLGAQVSRSLGIPLLSNALVLKKQSISQMGLALLERRKNRIDAFIASEAELVDKRVLLLDDVMTSGQTLLSAIKAIQLVKPRMVSALVLARTPP
jgi:competence protein ComFC